MTDDKLPLEDVVRRVADVLGGPEFLDMSICRTEIYFDSEWHAFSDNESAPWIILFAAWVKAELAKRGWLIYPEFNNFDPPHMVAYEYWKKGRYICPEEKLWCDYNCPLREADAILRAALEALEMSNE